MRSKQFGNSRVFLFKLNGLIITFQYQQKSQQISKFDFVKNKIFRKYQPHKNGKSSSQNTKRIGINHSSFDWVEQQLQYNRNLIYFNMTTNASKKKQEGNAYFNKKEYQLAKKAYLEGLQIEPNDLSLLSNLSMVYFSLEMYDESKKICDRVISLDPEHNKAIYRKAYCCQKLEDHFQAIQAASQSIQIIKKSKSPNMEVVESLNKIIKEAKDKLKEFGYKEAKELSFIKVPIVQKLSDALKNAFQTVNTDDAPELRKTLTKILNQSVRGYNSETLVELQKVKKKIYYRLVELQSQNSKKVQILDILLSSINPQEQKIKLLKLKLQFSESSQLKIEVLKQLLELEKNSSLEFQLKQLQKVLIQQFQNEYKKEKDGFSESVENIQNQNSKINKKMEQNSHKEGRVQDGEEVKNNTEINQNQGTETPKQAQENGETLLQKLKTCEKHKNLEEYFQLFKRINQSSIEDGMKIRLVTEMSKSPMASFFSKGAGKGQKNYIKKLCKELDIEEIYVQFKFK